MPDLDDKYLRNYVNFQLGQDLPLIKGRIKAHINFWKQLNTPDWLLDLIGTGVTIPWDRYPPRFLLPNNKSVVDKMTIPIVRNILNEYEDFGFIRKVHTVPYCVLPLQLKVTGDKQALIYDMSPLNEYVEKSSFKLEGWEEMFDYAQNAVAGIKFDLKKFYHEIDIADSFQQFFGFAYPMKDGEDPSYFVWISNALRLY